MNKIMLIAGMTYKDMVRDRILYALMAFSLIMIAVSFLMASLSLSQELKVQISFGLASIHLGGVLLAIFSGSSVILKEIESKTVFTILSRPLSRLDFLLGKFLGLWLLIVFCSVVLSVSLGFSLLVMEGEILFINYMWALLGILLELSVILASALFFSCFASSFILAVIFSGCFFAISHSINAINYFLKQGLGPVLKSIAWATTKIFPNMEALNWRYLAVYGDAVDYSLVSSGFLTSLFWTVLFLTLSMAILERKDFS